MMERRVLLIGAGSSKLLSVPTPLFNIKPTLTTLDIEPSHKTDVVWDLNVCPWPFEDNSFDEIHGYEILEHLGQQGDAKSFFAHFWEIYRILNPLGTWQLRCRYGTQCGRGVTHPIAGSSARGR